MLISMMDVLITAAIWRPTKQTIDTQIIPTVRRIKNTKHYKLLNCHKQFAAKQTNEGTNEINNLTIWWAWSAANKCNKLKQKKKNKQTKIMLTLLCQRVNKFPWCKANGFFATGRPANSAVRLQRVFFSFCHFRLECSLARWHTEFCVALAQCYVATHTTRQSQW